jgi:hypothetical protein
MTLSKRNKKKHDSNYSFGRPRSLDDYRRRQGRISPGKVIVIVCEGKETEPNYFGALRQKFRLSTLEIKVVSGKGAPIKVVECAVDEKRKLDETQDEVWCVLDTENPNENSTLRTAIEKARKSKINLAISNPCFEYWYFIHFESSSRPFSNGQEMKQALKGHISDYDESLNVFLRIDSFTLVAIRNAESLRGRSQESWDTFPNPSTGVDILVQEIIKIGKVRRY